MNWIRPAKRLAIYLRDGLACAWCGTGIEDGPVTVRLTLDHLRPYLMGGSNDAANLVTSCRRCNSGRGVRSVRDFAFAVAGQPEQAPAIAARVRALARRRIDVPAARAVIASRGGLSAALRGGR